MLTHVVIEAADGFHVAYQVPGCNNTFSSVMLAPSRQAAQTEAYRLNVEQQRLQAISQEQARDRLERPIPTGFYSDEDAA
jgi:hypothetical protein